MEPRVGQVFFGTSPRQASAPPERPGLPDAPTIPRLLRDHKAELATAAAQGPISQLQELVQCSKRSPVAQNRPILSWSFDARAHGGGMQQFMATVSCYIHGVPHYLAGGWHSSKKLAQRDAAQRALELVARQMGGWAQLVDGAGQRLRDGASEDEVRQLELLCSPAAGSRAAEIAAAPPSWSVTDVGDAHVAVLEVTLLGVGHSFCGAPQESPEAARRDAARRTLWYLRHPGYADAFRPSEANSDAAAAAAPCDGQAEARRAVVDSPPVPWRKGCTPEPLVKRPTLADTETRLRRLLGMEGRPAEQVWQWSAKSLEGSSAAAPVRYRAAVRVPAVARTFTGPWRHSAYKAEKAACALLEDFLDSWCKEPPPREAPLPPDPGRCKGGGVAVGGPADDGEAPGSVLAA